MATRKKTGIGRILFYLVAGAIIGAVAIYFIISVILHPQYYFSSNRILGIKVAQVPTEPPHKPSLPRRPPKTVPKDKETTPKSLYQRIKSGEKVNLTLTITDEKGTPLPNALVYRVLNQDDRTDVDDLRTFSDEKGKCVFPLKLDFFGRYLSLIVRVPGYVPCRVQCYEIIKERNSKGRYRERTKLMEECTVSLTKGVTIGGKVQLDDGTPLPHQEVTLSPPIILQDCNGKKRLVDGNFFTTTVQTDENGHWTYDSAIDRSKDKRYRTWVTVKLDGYKDESDHLQSKQRQKLLEEGKLITKLRKENGLTGRVVDAEGKPIQGATVFIDKHYQVLHETDAEGRFQIEDVGHLARQRPAVVILVKDFAPLVHLIEAEDLKEPVEFRITDKGRKVLFHLYNTNSKPIQGAKITIKTVELEYTDPENPNRKIAKQADLRTLKSFNWDKSDLVSVTTDAQGKVCMENAPEAPFCYTITCPGRDEYNAYMVAYQEDVDPRNPEHYYLFTIQDPFHATGKITDAQTGQPIPQAKLSLFYTTHGLVWPQKQFIPPVSRSKKTDSKITLTLDSKGHYDLEDKKTIADNFSLLVEADGYAPVYKQFKDNEYNITFDPKLEPTKPLEVQVLTTTGKPAAGAKGILGSEMFPARINDAVDDGDSDVMKSFAADAQGTLQVPPYPLEKFKLLVLHEDGFAVVDKALLKKTPEVHLQPWAKLDVSLDPALLPATPSKRPDFYIRENLQIGPEFRLDPQFYSGKIHDLIHNGSIQKNLLPGKAFVGYQKRIEGPNETMPRGPIEGKIVDLQSGKTTKLTLNGKEMTPGVKLYTFTSCGLGEIILSRLSIGLTTPKIVAQLQKTPDFKDALFLWTPDTNITVVGTPEQTSLLIEIIDQLREEALKEDHPTPPEGYPTLSIQNLEADANEQP